MTHDSQLTQDEIFSWMDKIQAVIHHNYTAAKPYSFMNEIIKDFLYLGDDLSAKYTQIRRQRINFVLNCCGVRHTDYPKDEITEHVIFASDSNDYPLIAKHADECIRFVDKCKTANGRILIHCMAGVNRSATLTIVYLLHYYKHYQLLHAVEHVVKCRPEVLQNTAFQQQLVKYAQSIHKLTGFVPPYLTLQSQQTIDIVQWQQDEQKTEINESEAQSNVYDACRAIVMHLIQTRLSD